MVNWREDIEFFYVLSMLISSIVVFFYFYDTRGLQFAGIAAFIIVLVEVVIGFASFETDRAMTAWEKIGKDQNVK